MLLVVLLHGKFFRKSRMFDLKIIELFGYPNAIQKPNCFSDSNNS
jgi:hypothetical protein